MTKLKKTQKIIGLSILGILTGISPTAFAGGFQLFEENVTNMGNAYAGTGAEASDASTEFYNPAGMVRLCNPQIQVAGSLIDLNVHVDAQRATDTQIISGVAPVIGPFNFLTVNNVAGQTDIHPGEIATVPAFHMVYPVDNRWAVGLGVNAPFGLETTYPEDSLTRFLATKSQITVIDVSPTIAFRILPQFSVGAGIDEQYFDAKFNQHVPGAEIAGEEIGEANFTNDGDDWAPGWHAGVLYEITPATRVGATYHSQVKHTIEGDATLDFDLTNVGIPLQVDIPGHLSANVTLPDYWDLSLYHDFNDQWAVLSSLDYTHWSSIQSVVGNFSGELGKVVSNAVIPLDFKNTYRISAGVNYRPSQRWTLRTGVAYDESPVQNDTSRTFRLPDNDRYWLAFGAQYIINKEFTVDAGYAHLFVPHSNIDNTQRLAGGLTVPTGLFGPIPINFAFIENAAAGVDANINEVGVQLTWNIDAV